MFTVESFLFVRANFRGLSKRGNWFVVFRFKTFLYFVKRSWGRKFMGKGKQQNPRTLIPRDNNDIYA